MLQENMTFSAQEYLAWEAAQIDKHEYVAGVVDRKSVERFRRQADGGWLLRDFTGEENCVFESAELTMSMQRVFEDSC